MQGLIGNDSILQEKERQQDQEDDPRDGAPNRLLFEQQSTDEDPQRHQGEASDKRIALGCLHDCPQIDHLRPYQLTKPERPRLVISFLGEPRRRRQSRAGRSWTTHLSSGSPTLRRMSPVPKPKD